MSASRLFSPRARRRGFTLLEAMLGIVTSGLVVLLAYATVQEGALTEARLARPSEEEVTFARVRGMLADGARHAMPGAGSMVVARDAAGHATALAFRTRGVVSPFGTGRGWTLALARDEGGLRLVARDEASTLATTTRGAAAFDVRFKPLGEVVWLDAWSDSLRLPEAIEIRFGSRDGRPVGTPLVVRTSPLGGA